jgi:AhpD family alkylhydroperoxidase
MSRASAGRCLDAAITQNGLGGQVALRLPKVDLPSELREDMIKQLGAVPVPLEVIYNNPVVAISNQDFTAKMAEWNAVDASLKTFAHIAVAAQVGCSWCLDINYFAAQDRSLDQAKARGAALAGIRRVHGAGA